MLRHLSGETIRIRRPSVEDEEEDPAAAVKEPPDSLSNSRRGEGEFEFIRFNSRYYIKSFIYLYLAGLELAATNLDEDGSVADEEDDEVECLRPPEVAISR